MKRLLLISLLAILLAACAGETDPLAMQRRAIQAEGDIKLATQAELATRAVELEATRAQGVQDARSLAEAALISTQAAGQWQGIQAQQTQVAMLGQVATLTAAPLATQAAMQATAPAATATAIANNNLILAADNKARNDRTYQDFMTVAKPVALVLAGLALLWWSVGRREAMVIKARADAEMERRKQEQDLIYNDWRKRLIEFSSGAILMVDDGENTIPYLVGELPSLNSRRTFTEGQIADPPPPPSEEVLDDEDMRAAALKVVKESIDRFGRDANRIIPIAEASSDHDWRVGTDWLADVMRMIEKTNSGSWVKGHYGSLGRVYQSLTVSGLSASPTPSQGD